MLTGSLIMCKRLIRQSRDFVIAPNVVSQPQPSLPYSRLLVNPESVGGKSPHLAYFAKTRINQFPHTPHHPPFGTLEVHATQSNPLKAVRGTRDLLPPETALWNRVESIARSVFSRYGFGEIRTPIFEDTQLFARGVGEETDIVSKEMYTWDDRDRFDERRLRERWIEMYTQDEYIGSRSNVKAGTAEIDLVAERRGVVEGQEVLITELVEFKPEVRQFDVDR